MVVSLAISLLRHVPEAHAEILSGVWRQHIGGQLSGRTVGIIGCGFGTSITVSLQTKVG